MDILEKINNIICNSQCYIKKTEDNTFLLYDEYNQININVYSVLDFEVIMRDIEIHMKKKIQNHITENLLAKLNEYILQKYMMNVTLVKDGFELIGNNWEIIKIRKDNLKSFNIRYLKIIMSEAIQNHTIK